MVIKKNDTHPKVSFGKNAILLINLGTPESTSKKDIKRYLKEFLSDNRIIEINKYLWWFILNECDDFIWTNDDIYLMKEISFSELEKPLYLQDLNQVKIRNMNRWGRLLWRTTDKLKEKDLTIFNGECHTPYYYQNHLIKKIFYDYEIHIGKGLLRTAYINNFYDKDELVPMGNKKCGFYSPSNIKINESSIYLNHDDFGLTSSLKSKIEELFPWKSRWER